MSALRMLPRARPMHLDPCMAMGLRFASGDQTRVMSGDREVVGYGINGRSIYFDSQDCPFPAIRFREVTPEVCALREKELGDWKKLSLCEKKVLYRHSFCQTYAEFQKFSPDWKLVLGVGFWALAIGCALSVMSKLNMYNDPPDTYDEEHRAAQLRRIIQLQMNPILGLSSKWCYERNQWK